MLARTIQLHVLQFPLSNFRVLTRRARLDRLVQNDHVPLIGFAASKATNANHCRLEQETISVICVTINIKFLRKPTLKGFSRKQSTPGNCLTKVVGHVVVLFSLAFLPHVGQNLYFSCIHAPQNLQNMMSALI